MDRYLFNVEDHAVVAYARGGHDFRRASDDTLWAHESQDTLLAARSGTTIARRVGHVYYDVDTNEALYYQPF